jgi:drug/metabolite transporter (DMT)-like permease
VADAQRRRTEQLDEQAQADDARVQEGYRPTQFATRRRPALPDPSQRPAAQCGSTVTLAIGVILMTYVTAIELPTNRLALAIACAIGAAVSYGLSNVLQQREAEQLSEEKTLKVGLLAQLARRPRWLIGMGADVAGYALEAVALGVGTLVLVEPILATSLLLSLLLGAAINRRSISRAAWIAAVVFAIGVSVFLYLAAPTQGTQLASDRSWLIAAPLIAGFVLACIAASRGASGPRRAICLGIGAGTLFGTSALLTKAFVHYLAGGILNWIPHWEPYALAVSAIGGLILSQSAFQTGALAAAVSAEQLLQPLTGVALGIGMLDEHIDLSGAVPTILLVIAFVAMIWGVLALARAEHDIVALPPAVLADG